MRHGLANALPTTGRRHGRLATCATAAVRLWRESPSVVPAASLRRPEPSNAPELPTPCRPPVGDTAGWQPALPLQFVFGASPRLRCRPPLWRRLPACGGRNLPTRRNCQRPADHRSATQQVTNLRYERPPLPIAPSRGGRRTAVAADGLSRVHFSARNAATTLRSRVGGRQALPVQQKAWVNSSFSGSPLVKASTGPWLPSTTFSGWKVP